MTVLNSRVAALEQSYDELLALCDALEAVADGLPYAVNARVCLGLSASLEPLLARTHGLEEAVLFPLLAASQNPQLSQTLERLRQEHLADHSTAAEVGECLHDLGAGRPTVSADAIGYLLRSFFESMRRHVQSERELLAMARPGDDHGSP